MVSRRPRRREILALKLFLYFGLTGYGHTRITMLMIMLGGYPFLYCLFVIFYYGCGIICYPPAILFLV